MIYSRLPSIIACASRDQIIARTLSMQITTLFDPASRWQRCRWFPAFLFLLSSMLVFGRGVTSSASTFAPTERERAAVPELSFPDAMNLEALPRKVDERGRTYVQ